MDQDISSFEITLAQSQFSNYIHNNKPKWLVLTFFFYYIICNNIKPNKENKKGNPPYKQTQQQKGDYHYHYG